MEYNRWLIIISTNLLQTGMYLNRFELPVIYIVMLPNIHNKFSWYIYAEGNIQIQALKANYSDHLSNYPSVCLSVCLSIFLCIFLSNYSSIHSSIHLSIYLSWHPFIHPSINPSMHLSMHLIYLSVCLPINYYISKYNIIYHYNNMYVQYPIHMLNSCVIQ